MTEAEKLIEELKTLVEKNDQASLSRIDEIGAWFRSSTEENRKKVRDFIERGLDKASLEIEDIMNCIEKLKA